MNLKTNYANRKKYDFLNGVGDRLLEHYMRIVDFRHVNTVLDIGSGDGSFHMACKKKGLVSHKLDYPEFDAERNYIMFEPKTIDLITLNAVIEHIKDPSHIMTEIYKVLSPKGKVIIRTTNFRMDYKNFYNDVTHVKPYTPESLKMLLELSGFKVTFCEPGLILKSDFWYTIPFKWTVAKYLTGGTKSVIIVGEK